MCLQTVSSVAHIQLLRTRRGEEQDRVYFVPYFVPFTNYITWKLERRLFQAVFLLPMPFFWEAEERCRAAGEVPRFPDCDPCSCKGQSHTAGTEPTPWELLVSVISHQYIQDICFSIPHPVFFCWEFKQEKSYSICLMYVNYHGNHRISCAQGVFLNSARSYSSVCLCSSVRFH